jgi:hypothetical protein
MENNPGYSPDVLPSKKGPEKIGKDTEKGEKKEKKKDEAKAPHLERRESSEKQEKAEKIAKTETLWQRIIGEEEKPDDEKSNAESRQPEAEGEIDLADTEAKEIALEHVETRQQEVDEELKHTEPGTVEADVAAANAVLLDKGEAHLANEQETFREALESATAETEQVIVAPPEETAPAMAAQSEAAKAVESEPPKPEEPPIPPEAPINPFLASYRQERLRHAVQPAAVEAPAPTREVDHEVYDDTAGGLLAGTFIGSWWTRRRIRKQVDRRVRPFQRSVEQEINQVKSAVTEKEAHIRNLAAAQHNLQREVRSETVRSQTSPETHPQQAPAKAPEQAAYKTAEIHPKEAWERPRETLNDQQVLAWSEKIIIDGASVRSVYEARRISENGLERVVHEYLRGGNVRKVLAEEVLKKELSYERDPILREHFAGTALDGIGAGTAVAPLGAPAANQSQPTAALAPSRPKQPALSQIATSPRQMAIAAWATFVFVLVCIVIILLLSR